MKAPRVAELKHKIALCTMQDVVEDAKTMSLQRPMVANIWARVQSRQTYVAALNFMVAGSGYMAQDSVKRAGYFITFRAAVGVQVTSAAWVYEPFRKSPPRWYKVLGFTEQPGWITLSCVLHELSDQVTPPSNTLSPQPTMVPL